jgi:hypothetical protein
MANELEEALKAFEDAFNMGGVQQPATPAMTTQAPITASALPPKPPEPEDTFTPFFKRAVQDERFAALPDDEKWKFINLAMDDDEAGVRVRAERRWPVPGVRQNPPRAGD